MNRSKCPDCNSVAINIFEDQGDGKCDKCLGQGLGDLMDQFTANLVHEKSQCLKCHGTGQCQTCGGTGFVKYEDSTTDTSRSSFSSTDTPRQESHYSSSSGSSADYSSSSDGSGCGVIIGWLIGIIVVVVIAIWLALNIVLPIALLNSALAFTILALCFKERKTLFASLALVGGCYMLIDIFIGWFSANFVNNIVGNPVWITCFVYFNAAAISLSVWFLVQPLWANATEVETSDKNKSLLLKGVSILLVATATIAIPLVYHLIQNPFLKDFKNQEVSSDVPTKKDVPAKKDDVEDTDKIVALNPSNLIGTWEGTFGSNNAASNIKIDKIKGNTFYGVLNKQGTRIAFTGSMNANTREITFKETKVISLGNAKDWKLGTNKGVFSNNGQTIIGKGEDGRSSYSWKFSKQ